MAARSKKAKPAEPAAEKQNEAPAKSETVVYPVGTQEGLKAYRTDLGESLPPQKKPGVV